MHKKVKICIKFLKKEVMCKTVFFSSLNLLLKKYTNLVPISKQTEQKAELSLNLNAQVCTIYAFNVKSCSFFSI